jgi:hypothetical protein
MNRGRRINDRNEHQHPASCYGIIYRTLFLWQFEVVPQLRVGVVFRHGRCWSVVYIVMESILEWTGVCLLLPMLQHAVAIIID